MQHVPMYPHHPALTNTTNLTPRPTQPHPKPPRFTLSRPRKASPTLALTHAHISTSCITTTTASSTPPASNILQTNSVPFPSSALSEPIDIPVPHSTTPLRRRASAPHPHPPARKRPRKTKSKSTAAPGVSRRADTQLLASVHRSIVWRLRGPPGEETMDVDGERGSESESALEAQDRILAERIWHNLLERGCTPVLFDAPAPASPPPTPEPAAEQADFQVRSMPQLVATLLLRRHECERAKKRSRSVGRGCSPLAPSSRP